jgi:hypothetical protein
MRTGFSLFTKNTTRLRKHTMKKIVLLLLIPLLLTLSACGSISLPGSQSSSSQQSSTGANAAQQPNFANQPVEQKLAIGTLKLEGTDKAVTADQAKTLLPLWKAMKSLGNSSTTSQAETDALYKQIEDAMTADQMKAIKDMTLKPEDFSALMKQYNVQMPQGMPRVQGTRAANSNGANSGNGQQAGGGPGGDFPPGGAPGGDFPGGGTNGQSNVQRTPRANGTPRPGQGRGPRGGMNLLFVDPLITVLTQRTGS